MHGDEPLCHLIRINEIGHQPIMASELADLAPHLFLNHALTVKPVAARLRLQMDKLVENGNSILCTKPTLIHCCITCSLGKQEFTFSQNSWGTWTRTKNG